MLTFALQKRKREFIFTILLNTEKKSIWYPQLEDRTDRSFESFFFEPHALLRVPKTGSLKEITMSKNM